MATCSSSRALPSSRDHCSSSSGAPPILAQQRKTIRNPLPRNNLCQNADERGQSSEEYASSVLCDRGCPLVNGICPISEAEWRQAVLDKQAANSNNGQKQAPELAMTPNQNQRKWQQRAIVLSLFTILYGIAEGTIGLALGSETVSISLLAFGADSWVEVISGSLVCWRFYEELRGGGGTAAKRTATQKERIATIILGLLLCLLSLAVIGGSIGALVIHEEPESSLVNIIVGAVSVAYMSTLYVLKTRVALSLKSSTIETDAQCSLFCVQLSLVLVVGGIIFREVSSVWWFDSATAIVIALMIAKEGVGTVRASLKKDFTGAGCGCDGEDDGWLMRFMRKRIKKEPSGDVDVQGVKVIKVACCGDIGSNSSCTGGTEPQIVKSSCCEKGESSHCTSDIKQQSVEIQSRRCGEEAKKPLCSSAAKSQPAEAKSACCGEKREQAPSLSTAGSQLMEIKSVGDDEGEKPPCSSALKTCKSGC